MSANIGTPPPTQALNLSNGTLAASAPLFTGAQTWNNAAVAFVAFSLNVIDTASATASLLCDWQVGGVSRFKVNKSGTLTTPGYVECNALKVGYVNDPTNAITHLDTSNNASLLMSSGRFQFNGRTSSFPALKRSGTQLQARLADDSAFTEFCGKLNLETDAPPTDSTDPGTTGQIRYDAEYIYLCVATNTWVRSALSTW